MSILLLGSFFLLSNVCIGRSEESVKRKQDSEENSGSYEFRSNHKCYNQKKYIYPLEVVDSIIGGYQITYKMLINIKELIPSSYSIEVTGDTLYYAGTDILLCLKKNSQIYFEKIISKKDFYPFLEKKDIPYYSINNMLIEGVKNDSVSFLINLCIPDTDVCYDFILDIGDDGGMDIKECYIEAEMFE